MRKTVDPQIGPGKKKTPKLISFSTKNNKQVFFKRTISNSRLLQLKQALVVYEQLLLAQKQYDSRFEFCVEIFFRKTC